MILSRKTVISAALPVLFLTGLLSYSVLAAAQSDQPAPSQPAAAQPTPAQPATPPAANPRPAQRHPQNLYRGRTLDDNVKALTKALNLNEMQQQGVRSVLERQRLQVRRIQFDQTLSGEERIGQFRALQGETVLRIRALLNDEQKLKYDPLNHGTQTPGSSDSYVDQWMKYHQRADQPQAPKK